MDGGLLVQMTPCRTWQRILTIALVTLAIHKVGLEEILVLPDAEGYKTRFSA